MAASVLQLPARLLDDMENLLPCSRLMPQASAAVSFQVVRFEQLPLQATA